MALFLWWYLQQASSSSHRQQQYCHPNKVGDRYNSITAGDDESNFPTREIGIHTIAHSWAKNVPVH
jgi:hypothetical protein